MKVLLALLCMVGACLAINYEHAFPQMMKDINAKKPTWKSGYNEYFHGKSMESIKNMMGVKKAKRPVKLPVKKATLPRAQIPASFDSRTQWSNCASISHIRDQANCGSCWAVAAAEVMTDRICIGSNGAQNPSISAENLMSCCYLCGEGCNGGDPGSAMSYWQRTGVVTGGDYGSNDGCQPYTQKPCSHHTGQPTDCTGNMDPTPACKRSCETGYNTPYKTDLHKASKSYSVDSSVTAIQTEIMTNGPVEAGFDVYEDFLTYKTGVYKHVSGALDGGHAVKIIGWGTENNQDYWLVANSWNTTWGDNGYFKIARGTDECGIEDDIVAGIAKI